MTVKQKSIIEEKKHRLQQKGMSMWNKDENCSSFQFYLVFLRDERKKENKNKWNTHVHCSLDQKRWPLNAIDEKPVGGAMNGKPAIEARTKFSV